MKITELVGQDIEEVQALLTSGGHPSVYEDYGNFQLLIIRQMSITMHALSFSSYAFIFKDHKVYKADDQGDFSILEKGLEDLYELLHSYYQNNLKIVKGYGDEVESLELSLFERTIPGYFMDLWFELKKDLARIENYAYRNSMVYKEFFKAFESKFADLKDAFIDIDDLIQFQNSNLSTLKLRMDSTHHYYASIKNDRLNRTLLLLTLISGIFLPLNLVVGFFGMNTQGLFLEKDPQGTQVVLFILIGIVLLFLLGLPILKLLDRGVLRFIFGKYNFYNNISNKIDELEDRLKV